MNDSDEGWLAKSLGPQTSEDRILVAVESIAEQLRTLVALFSGPKTDSRASPGACAGVGGEEAWENEGGSINNEWATSSRIKHTTTDLFETGGYRYTKLADAMAEVRRAGAASVGRG